MKSNTDLETHYEKESTIVEILSEVEMHNHKFQKVISSDLIDTNRFVMSIETKNIYDGKLYRTAVDTILGEPTWQQMMAITYDHGADHEKKIVIYNDIRGLENPHSCIDNRDMAHSLADINNDSGMATYIILATKVSDNDIGAGFPIEYTAEKMPGYERKTKFTHTE